MPRDAVIVGHARDFAQHFPRGTGHDVHEAQQREHNREQDRVDRADDDDADVAMSEIANSLLSSRHNAADRRDVDERPGGHHEHGAERGLRHVLSGPVERPVPARSCRRPPVPRPGCGRRQRHSSRCANRRRSPRSPARALRQYWRPPAPRGRGRHRVVAVLRGEAARRQHPLVNTMSARWAGARFATLPNRNREWPLEQSRWMEIVESRAFIRARRRLPQSPISLRRRLGMDGESVRRLSRLSTTGGGVEEINRQVHVRSDWFCAAARVPRRAVTCAGRMELFPPGGTLAVLRASPGTQPPLKGDTI